METIELTKESALYLELKDYVPEVEEYPLRVVKGMLDMCYETYPSDKDKIIRFYYLGYLLTTEDETLNSSKVQVSNVVVEGKDNSQNPYWLKLNRLLDLRRNDKYGTRRKTKIVII